MEYKHSTGEKKFHLFLMEASTTVCLSGQILQGCSHQWNEMIDDFEEKLFRQHINLLFKFSITSGKYPGRSLLVSHFEFIFQIFAAIL